MLPRTRKRVKTSRNLRDIPLYIPEQHKPVAGFDPIARELHKRIDGRRHIHRRLGIGIDTRIVDQAREMCALSVLVVDGETGTRYSCDITTFVRYAIVDDQGHGAQHFLALRYWRRDGAPSEAEALAAAMAPQPEEQATLFDVAAVPAPRREVYA